MRVLLAAIVFALLAGPAFAQKSIPKYGELEGKPDHEIKAEKEAERAYQKSLGRIPEQKGSSDPWGTMRGDSAPKTGAKDPPAKRAKADGAK